MANQKLTQLLAAGSVIHGLAAEDLLYAVDDPLGTPISKTITALDALGFYNVKGYGAVGDGIVDDTAAIQAAKTALLTSGGGILYIPNVAAGSAITPYTNVCDSPDDICLILFSVVD